MATETTPKVKVHVVVVMGTLLDGRGHFRNLCGVAGRGETQLNLLQGWSPVLGTSNTRGTLGNFTGDVQAITCFDCRSALASLGHSLDTMAETTETLAARERAFAQRRMQWQLESFQQQVQALAASYTRMARDVDETLQRFQRAGALPTAGDALKLATDLVHHQAWAVANTGLDTLIARAAELDATAREAQ